MTRKKTTIDYVKSSGNVFADLGLPHPERAHQYLQGLTGTLKPPANATADDFVDVMGSVMCESWMPSDTNPSPMTRWRT